MLHTVLSNPLFTPIVVMLVIIAAFPLVAGYIVLVAVSYTHLPRR